MFGHPHRKRLRLPGFDYTSPGAYFVTICTYRREDLFGDVREGVLALTVAGRHAANTWSELPAHFPRLSLDTFCVMPNHVHGILIFHARDGGIPVGAKHASPLPASPLPESPLPASPLRVSPSPGLLQCGSCEPGPASTVRRQARGTTGGSLAAVVQAFKAASARRINLDRGTPGSPVWQRGYYEHIIRSPGELGQVRRYIECNPLRWELDRENPLRR